MDLSRRNRRHRAAHSLRTQSFRGPFEAIGPFGGRHPNTRRRVIRREYTHGLWGRAL